MKNKFNIFNVLASICLIFFAGIGVYLDYDNDSYFQGVYDIMLSIESGMEYRCLNVEEGTGEIQMSEKGLEGECGFIFSRRDKLENCLGIYTFGEDINITKKMNELIDLKETRKSFTLLILRILRWFSLILALFFFYLAIVKGLYNIPKLDNKN